MQKQNTEGKWLKTWIWETTAAGMVLFTLSTVVILYMKCLEALNFWHWLVHLFLFVSLLDINYQIRQKNKNSKFNPGLTISLYFKSDSSDIPFLQAEVKTPDLQAVVSLPLSAQNLRSDQGETAVSKHTFLGGAAGATRSNSCHPAWVTSVLYAHLVEFVCKCVLCVSRSQPESECVATLPETVSKSVVISKEFTVGCLPVVGAGGSYWLRVLSYSTGKEKKTVCRLVVLHHQHSFMTLRRLFVKTRDCLRLFVCDESRNRKGG